MVTTEQAAWDQRHSGPDLVWGAGPNRFVTEEVAALAAGRAIDLGTGEGRNAIWLAERGWQVTAVDFSAAGLARAGRLAGERGVSVDWVQADLLDYQPAPAATTWYSSRTFTCRPPASRASSAPRPRR